MNFLRKELAPITSESWAEIEKVAAEALRAALSGRKFVTVDGPHGIGYAAASCGRLAVSPDDTLGNVKFGVHQVQPLIEARIPFSLDIWELDNLVRGAKDVEFDPVVDACNEIAAFEDKAIFSGFAPGCIQGLLQVAEPEVPVPQNPDAILEALSAGLTHLITHGIASAAHFVVGPEMWNYLARGVPGGTLRGLARRIIGGEVILSPGFSGAMLVADRKDDAILTLGQDFAIGYHSHTTKEVNLYVMESFTFRVVTPEALILYKIG